MNILKATYGSGDCLLDVTERLQGLVKNGHLHFTVSNSHFTDPCPGKVKILRFIYELQPGQQFYLSEAEEHKLVMAPLHGGDRIGIFYTNNAIPPKYLHRVLTQLKKAAGDVDIITCPWRPIDVNPFPEIPWSHHISSYLTITLQVLKLLHTAQELGQYEYVFFLEHDVLYPEGYFDIEPFSEDVLSNTNYMGLSEEGFLPIHVDVQPLHLLAMRLPAAIEHFTSCIGKLLMDEYVQHEPYNRTWATRQSSEPAVHINHGNHLSGWPIVFSKDEIEKSNPYWGSAASWWE